jgi:hypothetical protein
VARLDPAYVKLLAWLGDEHEALRGSELEASSHLIIDHRSIHIQSTSLY